MSTSSTVPPGSSQGPKTPAPLRTEAHRHPLGSAACRFFQVNRETKHKFYIQHNRFTVNRRKLSMVNSPIVVKHLGKHSRMSVEKVLVKYRIVIGQCLGQTRQSGSRNLLEGCLVCFISVHTESIDPSLRRRRHRSRSFGANIEA